MLNVRISESRFLPLSNIEPVLSLPTASKTFAKSRNKKLASIALALSLMSS